MGSYVLFVKIFIFCNAANNRLLFKLTLNIYIYTDTYVYTYINVYIYVYIYIYINW